MDVSAGSSFNEEQLLDLNKYDISHETGFLSVSPLTKLSGQYFTEWEKVLTELPQHVKRKTLREAIHQLPEVEFNDSTLKSREEWQRAYLLLCFLGQGYIWMEGETGIVDLVPRKIAVPWCSVSAFLGMPAVGTYSSTVLLNYKACNPNLPLYNMDNLDILHTFTGTKDETFFYQIHILMELAAIPGIRAIASIYNKIQTKDDRAVMECLKIIADSITKISETMGQIYKGCDTKTFFVEIRPFFAGSAGLDLFPNGIVYEGVCDLPKKFHGASAGQSSLLHMLDIFLGISQSGDTLKFVSSMLDYMPRGHREFLTQLKHMPSIHDYCKQSEQKDLIVHFNNAVEELVKFRNQHLIMVARYIINQRENSRNPSLDSKGTGGSDAMHFLKDVRDKTLARKIKMPESS